MDFKRYYFVTGLFFSLGVFCLPTVQAADGFDFACTDFNVGNNQKGQLTVNNPHGTSFIPLIMVERYESNGDDDFEYSITPTSRGSSYKFSYKATHGRGGSFVSGRACVLGFNADSFGHYEEHTVSNGREKTITLDTPHKPHTTTSRFLTIREFDVNDDDDVSFTTTFASERSRQATVHVSVEGGNDGSNIKAMLYELQTPDNVGVQMQTFSVDNGDSTTITFLAPDSNTTYFPIIAVDTYMTHGDDDMSWSTSCAQDGSSYRCTASVTKGNRESYIEGKFILLSTGR